MKPVYDEELVLQVEQHLQLDYLTRRAGYGIDMSDGLVAWRALGGLRAAGRVHVRAMFQVLHDHPPLLAASTSDGPPGTPCLACGDFSRSWSCEEHQAKARRW